VDASFPDGIQSRTIRVSLQPTSPRDPETACADEQLDLIESFRMPRRDKQSEIRVFGV
jgi:hypothetical protein